MKIPASIQAYQSATANGRRQSTNLTDDATGQSTGFSPSVDSQTESLESASVVSHVDSQNATSQAQAIYTVNGSAQAESSSNQDYPVNQDYPINQDYPSSQAYSEYPVQRAATNGQSAVNQYLAVAQQDADSLTAQDPSLFGVDTYV